MSLSPQEARERAIALLRAGDEREAVIALAPHRPMFEAPLRLLEAGFTGYALALLEDLPLVPLPAP